MKKSRMRGTIKAVDILRRDPCAFCGKYQRLKRRKTSGGMNLKKGDVFATVDHIHPRSKGGMNSWSNYTAACSDCNSEKGDNSLLGHLLGEEIPGSKPIFVWEQLPGTWYDPLGVITGIRLADRA